MSKYGPAIAALQEAIDATGRCYDHCRGRAQTLSHAEDEDERKSAAGMEAAATACFECLGELRSTLAGLESGTHEGLAASAEMCHATAQALDPYELDPSCFATAEACRAAEKRLRTASL